ncbi:MAG: large conductance mechanosensitive channel protein MscL [Erythrobacter sp.]|jgi:large conductance mechanosensitive channel|nr:large conductance mechanosensitive channel protein MscL [Erythrobacter sp.]MBA4080627.1 large conductance mechanosensitive channel protein MscL [Erythrobacter sp.]MBA4767336.1 large conductance mechanosensitive channel protein MscL [Porphyrobacter sp.]
MLSEFKTFIMRGNVLDLAVGVIIGAAFGTIIKSLTDDVIMPVITLMTGGGVDFSSKYIVLSGEAPAGASLAAAREAGANVLAFGSFVTAIINFVILAFVIFMIVRQANKLMPPPEAAPAGPTEVELLAEIRDALKK